MKIVQIKFSRIKLEIDNRNIARKSPYIKHTSNSIWMKEEASKDIYKNTVK